MWNNGTDMTLARERITNCADANQSWEQTSQVKGSLKKKKLQVCSIFCYINHHDKYSLKKKSCTCSNRNRGDRAQTWWQK